MKKNLFTAASAVIMIAALCAGAEAQVTPDKYPSVAEIPSSLRLKMGQYGGGQYREQYVSSLLLTIRQNGRTKQELDQQDIDDLKKKEIDGMRRNQMMQVLRYDADFDGKVTRAEITEIFSGERRRSETLNEEEITKKVDNVMKADIDGDGVLTLQEMSALPTEYNNYRQNSYAELEKILALDPDQNGKISVSELENLALKAFRTVDANGDGILSEEERKATEAANAEDQRQAQTRAMFPECKPFPAPADTEQVVQIIVYEGKAGTPNTIPLDVEKGDKKLYIVAAAEKPVTWQVSGAVDRISRIILAGPALPEGLSKSDNQINAKATGIPAANIATRHAGLCGFEGGYNEKSPGFLQGKRALKRLLGRVPDSVAVGQFAAGAKIDAVGNATLLPADGAPSP